MIQMLEYFLDTYAIIEYLRNNKSFVNIINNAQKIYLSKLNLMELYFISLRENGDDMAEKHYEAFALYETEIGERTIKMAIKEKLVLHKQGGNISYSDAISYQLAKEIGAKFLTGNKTFEKLPNVEFVK